MITRLGLLLFLAALGARAAEPEVDPSDLPRVPPTDPDKALATFKIKPGFRLELAVAEPVVVSPVAMAFDENGRLFVVEMRDYSERRPEKLGRIRLLEDTDGDGRFDKSTVFAADLPWPTAVTCYDGGIFIGATPDIIYFKDTDGDGQADVRAVVFTGFASDYAPFATNKLNVQALMNSFQWGLDNRIHGATGPSGGKVHVVESPFVTAWIRRGGGNPAAAYRFSKADLRGRDFSFDPRTLDLRAETGGGQHGMSFDNRGRKFVCSNSDHIQLIVYEDRYAARNPYFSMPSPRVSIAADGPAAEVYRLSPDEPWRVLRTKWRVAGQVPGPVEGGGRASGYFTGATGVTIYRGDAFGEEFVGDAFIADCGSNLIHRKKLRPDGVLFKAERPAGEQKVEFLASTDNWFRPVQFANAPDGCLYVIDMYREVIEHPWSLPPSLKKHLDLNSGHDRGRIYRIAPEKFKQPKLPSLGRTPTPDLVKLLAHPNGWHRDTAARLLYQRQDKTAVPVLAGLASGSRVYSRGPRPNPVTILHALYALDGLGALSETHLGAADWSLERDIWRVALGPGGPFLTKPSEALRELLTRHSAGPTLMAVSAGDLNLVLAMGRLRGELKLDLLLRYFIRGYTLCRMMPEKTTTLKRDLDSWLLPAAVNSLNNDAIEMYRRVAANKLPEGTGFVFPGAATELLASVARIIGVRNRSNEVAEVVASRSGLMTTPFDVLSGLDDGLRQSGSSLEQSGQLAKLQRQFELARDWAMPRSPPQSIDTRLYHIRFLGLAPYPEVKSNLLSLVSSVSEWPDVRRAALNALARSTHPDLAPDLLARWPQLTLTLRAEALGVFLKRPERIRALLPAIRDEVVRPNELSAAQLNFLRHQRDDGLRTLALQALGNAPKASRQEVVEAFQPALSLAGNAGPGRAVFFNRCSACHRADGLGHALGPDLASVKSNGKEKLLISILDPNREVAPAFVSYLIETKDGEVLTGLIGNETATGVTLRQAGGVETAVLRSNIAQMQSQGLSAMPEGLETGLSQQDMADLLEFLVAP